MKLIDYHNEWLKDGYMPHYGLCMAIPLQYERKLEMFEPSLDDVDQLLEEDKPTVFWGYGIFKKGNTAYDITHKYTPLRQTIVLFICAMLDEI